MSISKFLQHYYKENRTEKHSKEDMLFAASVVVVLIASHFIGIEIANVLGLCDEFFCSWRVIN